MAGRKPKFGDKPSSPTTLRLPFDVADAIRGDQDVRNRVTDAIVREVRQILQDDAVGSSAPDDDVVP